MSLSNQNWISQNTSGYDTKRQGQEKNWTDQQRNCLINNQISFTDIRKFGKTTKENLFHDKGIDVFRRPVQYWRTVHFIFRQFQFWKQNYNFDSQITKIGTNLHFLHMYTEKSYKIDLDTAIYITKLVKQNLIAKVMQGSTELS